MATIEFTDVINNRGGTMWRIIAIVLIVLWLLGKIAIHISTPLLHLLLIIAVVVFLYDMFVPRKN